MTLEAQQQRMTASEFDAWTELPENSDKLFELVSGNVVEKIPSNVYSSVIASRIIAFLMMYLFKNDIGYVSGEQGGYRVGDDRYAPDMAFVRYDKQKVATKKGYNPIVPDLVVEVISDTDNKSEWRALRRKVGGYLYHGAVVWIVDADLREVEVHRLGQEVIVYTINDTLDVGDLLPDFKLAVRDIFPTDTP